MFKLPTRSVGSLAVAVALTATATALVSASWRADAGPGDDDATFVPVAPCRLFDYRPGDQVGDRNTPLGPGETHTQQVTGDVGNCVGPAAVPPDAVGVSMNVTIAEPTAQSNLRVFPADVTEVPLASNLNWVAGQPPFPNKVDVKLSPDGAIKLTNFAGTVFVLADVVGYYTDDTLTEIDQRLTALETANDDDSNNNTGGGSSGGSNNPGGSSGGGIDPAITARLDALESDVAFLELAQPFAVTSRNADESVTADDEVVVSLTISAPVAGQVTVNSTTNGQESTPNELVRCSITTGTRLNGTVLQQFMSAGLPGYSAQLAGTRTFDVAAGSTTTFNLVCDHVGETNDALLTDSVLTAIFTPTEPSVEG